QRFHSAVAVGGAAQDDDGVTGAGQVPQGGHQRAGAEVVRGAELLQRARMQSGHRLHQVATPVVRLLAQGLRDGGGVVGLALVVPGEGTHPQQVHHTAEGVVLPDGELDHQGCRVQPGAEGGDRVVEPGAGPVHLVDERDPGHAVPVGLPPHRLALRFHPGDRVEHGDGTVEDAQGAFHLVGEVDVPGGVDEVDAVTVPGAADGGGEDGDAPVAFLGVEVGDGGAVVDLAAAVRGAGGVEDPLGDGGLAGVHVGED